MCEIVAGESSSESSQILRQRPDSSRCYIRAFLCDFSPAGQSIMHALVGRLPTTHPGGFHCDEVISSCYQNLVPSHTDSSILHMLFCPVFATVVVLFLKEPDNGGNYEILRAVFNLIKNNSVYFALLLSSRWKEGQGKNVTLRPPSTSPLLLCIEINWCQFFTHMSTHTLLCYTLSCSEWLYFYYYYSPWQTLIFFSSFSLLCITSCFLLPVKRRNFLRLISQKATFSKLYLLSPSPRC